MSLVIHSNPVLSLTDYFSETGFIRKKWSLISDYRFASSSSPIRVPTNLSPIGYYLISIAVFSRDSIILQLFLIILNEIKCYLVIHKLFLTHTKRNQALKIKCKHFILTEIQYYKKNLQYLSHKMHAVIPITQNQSLVALNFRQFDCDCSIYLAEVSPIHWIIRLPNRVAQSFLFYWLLSNYHVTRDERLDDFGIYPSESIPSWVEWDTH